MKATTLFSCSLMTVFVSSVQTDHCELYSMTGALQHFVYEGQPFAATCSFLDLERMKYNLTWYKAGSHIPLSKDQRSRIQQQQDFIWFLPALPEDSGSYECAIRNSTFCKRMYLELTVIKKSSSCFNAQYATRQELLTSGSGRLVCPELDLFKEETVLWYKDCKMIENERFKASGISLIITNVSLEDQGSYTCKMPYNYMEKQYSISRDINLTVTERPTILPPEILNPTNHSIEVEPGSSIVVDCIVSGVGRYDVYWKVNDTPMYFYYTSNMFTFYEKEITHEGRPLCILTLNISKVSNKEYEQPFVCHASNDIGHASAYVTLRRKVKDIQGPLIGVFVAVFLLTTVSILIYSLFKIDIVLCYRSSGCPLKGKEVSDGKLYDAYVLCLRANRMGRLYSLDNFVLNTLPEVLERQCGYNLFIVGRDDLPGQAVVSVTDDTIKQSRRLMIILEPGLSSCNGLEETSQQQIAVYDALIRCGIKVILIEVDKILDYVNMPESIKYIKQKHGAIRWKKDFEEQSQWANTKFWKNVRYRMPPRKLESHSETRMLPQVHTNSVTTITQ